MFSVLIHRVAARCFRVTAPNSSLFKDRVEQWRIVDGNDEVPRIRSG